MGKREFKAIIRVVKSLNSDSSMNSWYGFDYVEIIREPLIIAESKDDVKRQLLDKYPQFFPNNKIYERETKDKAQFFYVVIYELFEWEKKLILDGAWTCSFCGHVHENRYLSKPETNDRVLGRDLLFCRSEESHCMKSFISEKYSVPGVLLDDDRFITKSSCTYIYRCEEKSTGKSYIGKTKNAPFFRWWNHLKHSNSPFGVYLRSTLLSDWRFEVIEVLPSSVPDSEVLRIESEHILKHNSINNGFNQLVSNKKAQIPCATLFDDQELQ